MTELKRTIEHGRSSWITGACFAALILAGSARADWADDFDSGFAESWLYDFIDDAGNPPATGLSTFDIIEDGADDFLQISHSTTALQDGGGGATDGFGFVDEIFTDATISAEINAKPSFGQQNLLGVIGRGNVFSGTAYVAVIDFANSFFGIGRTDNAFELINALAIDTSVIIDPNETYRIEFVTFGSALTARLTEMSSGDIVSTVAAVDAIYSSGVAGIFVETEYDSLSPVAPIIGTFDNVEAVPEPSSVGMIAGGVCALSLLHAVGGRTRKDRMENETRRP